MVLARLHAAQIVIQLPQDATSQNSLTIYLAARVMDVLLMLGDPREGYAYEAP